MIHSLNADIMEQVERLRAIMAAAFTEAAA